MTRRKGRDGIPAPYALPVAFAALFLLGTLTAALNGRLPGSGVLVAAAIVTGVAALLSEPLTALPLGVIAWLTVIGFSRPPYADLHPTGVLATDAAVTLAATAGGCALAGTVFRSLAGRFTLDSVDMSADGRPAAGWTRRTGRAGGGAGPPGPGRSTPGGGWPGSPWP